MLEEMACFFSAGDTRKIIRFLAADPQDHELLGHWRCFRRQSAK
ncbi:hypothetical protein QFW77_14600 [Luteimonas sp. RD2P54]|uniref:Uncharacterized protein n=1 Tax=Luteimonas endophytica TaxID=3042023 RepID=A0ABT6JBK7_9GAMM|nr:hypothetical protein [Luteimonas endophytica]MDH5824208.1 hypothetical protein [Luteimonas endophytica]